MEPFLETDRVWSQHTPDGPAWGGPADLLPTTRLLKKKLWRIGIKPGGGATVGPRGGSAGPGNRAAAAARATAAPATHGWWAGAPCRARSATGPRPAAWRENRPGRTRPRARKVPGRRDGTD